jgi:hypothetical protein
MGYQVVSIVLEDGRRFDQVAVVEGLIAEVRGHKEIPFWIKTDLHKNLLLLVR